MKKWSEHNIALSTSANTLPPVLKQWYMINVTQWLSVILINFLLTSFQINEIVDTKKLLLHLSWSYQLMWKLLRTCNVVQTFPQNASNIFYHIEENNWPQKQKSNIFYKIFLKVMIDCLFCYFYLLLVSNWYFKIEIQVW